VKPRAGGEILAANLASLAEVQPELADLLGGLALEAGQEAYETLPTPSGAPTARWRGRLVHSAYDPRGEARRLVEAALPPGTDTAVILGSGLLYAAEEALATAGVGRVIVCEAEAPRLVASLAARDLRSLLADGRLSWMAGGEAGALLLALESAEGGGRRLAGLVGQKALEDLDPAWYGEVRAAFDRFAAKEAINENTLRRFGRLWVRNLARNAGPMASLPGIATLAERFAGLPALVLAAGPGLDLVLPRLAELRERLLLVVVDTALRSLLAAGTEPDFLVVVDPQYWNWRHVADLAAPGAFLVSESAVWPPVLRAPTRGTFLAASLFPLGRALDARRPGGGEGRGLLGAGGSVATSAWDFARLLGASPLVMAGLDLGYPGGQTHARASLFEQRALTTATRLGPAATSQAGALFGAGSRRVASTEGSTVLSDQRMLLYAWWFESRLARKDAPPTSTLSPGGVAIPGLPLVALESLLALPPRRREIDACLETAARLALSELGRESGEGALAELLSGLDGIAQRAEEGERAARSAREALARGGDPAPFLALLGETDAFLHGNEFRDVVGFFLPPLRELVDRIPRDLAESLELSASLYARIAASARENLGFLDLHRGAE